MSFEREAIESQATPQAPNPVMREERVIDPYRPQMARRAPPQAPPLSAAPKVSAGQVDTSIESPEEPKSPEETVRLSPQVAALARREQKFRQQQSQFEKERVALAAEREEIAQIKALKEKLAAKDYSALDGMVDYDEYSQYKVNKLNGADPTQEEFKKINSKLTEMEKFQQENVEKQFEAAVSERRTATTELVDKSDQFPRIKKAKAHEAVVQHILDTWEHDNKELSVEQAAKEVETILLEKAKQWASLLEEEKQEAANVDGKKPLPPMKSGSLKTLTNQVTSGDIKRAQKPLHLMNDAERYAEARRRAEEKLRLQGR